ncbi:hypothetical protein STEG23_027058, partial [Scotinomys teguina]
IGYEVPYFWYVNLHVVKGLSHQPELLVVDKNIVGFSICNGKRNRISIKRDRGQVALISSKSTYFHWQNELKINWGDAAFCVSSQLLPSPWATGLKFILCYGNWNCVNIITLIPFVLRCRSNEEFGAKKWHYLTCNNTVLKPLSNSSSSPSLQFVRLQSSSCSSYQTFLVVETKLRFLKENIST